MLSDMKRLSNWGVMFRPGGWVRVHDLAEGTRVYLHLRASGEGAQQRFNVHTTVMDSERPISSHTWRRVPIEIIEEVANGGRPREILRLPGGVNSPTLDPLEGHFYGSDGAVKAGEQLTMRLTDEHMKRWRSRSTAIEKVEQGSATDAPAPLEKPVGRISDEFLERIAETYLWLIDNDRAPAPVIAEQTSTPVRTVHRWISESRKRGYLPPGRAGRAG